MSMVDIAAQINNVLMAKDTTGAQLCSSLILCGRIGKGDMGSQYTSVLHELGRLFCAFHRGKSNCRHDGIICPSSLRKTMWVRRDLTGPYVWASRSIPSRMLKKAVQEGRSERRGEEVHTALRVGRSPLEWILANGKTPSAIPTLSL